MQITTDVSEIPKTVQRDLNFTLNTENLPYTMNLNVNHKPEFFSNAPSHISSEFFRILFLEPVAQRCSVKKSVFRNFAKFTGKHLRQSLFLNKVLAYIFIEKSTLAQVFSCEFCEISKNTFSYRTPLVAASIFHTFSATHQSS